MTLLDNASDMMIRRLASRASLDSDDHAAIRSLPFKPQVFKKQALLVEEGQKPILCPFILSGFTFVQKITSAGMRQIVSFQIPGDFVDSQNLFLKISDSTVQALTEVTTASVPLKDMRARVQERPNINRALWIDSLVDASVLREWVVNMGRRSAPQRVGHIICEFAFRLRITERIEGMDFELPITQEQLADAAGITPIHVNRVLKALADEGLISRDRRNIASSDWSALMAFADFNSRYLHLDQVEIDV